MGLLANDMALKTSGSSSSSKIRADKSEEDDDSPSRRYDFRRAAAMHMLGLQQRLPPQIVRMCMRVLSTSLD